MGLIDTTSRKYNIENKICKSINTGRKKIVFPATNNVAKVNLLVY